MSESGRFRVKLTIHFPQPRRRSYFERLTWGGSLLLDRGGLFLRCRNDLWLDRGGG